MVYSNGPNPSYYIASQNGSFSSEIIGYPPMEKMFPISYEYKNICLLEKVIESESKLSEWMAVNKSGVTICIIMNGDKTIDCVENEWLKARGFGGIFGDVMVTALSLNREEAHDVFIPAMEAMDIASKTLGKRDRTMSDCVVHAKNRFDYMSSRETLSISEIFAKRNKKGNSPDDSPLVAFPKHCISCKKDRLTNVTKVIKGKRGTSKFNTKACPCRRAYYCGKECQRKHWKEHKLVHRGVFI